MIVSVTLGNIEADEDNHQRLAPGDRGVDVQRAEDDSVSGSSDSEDTLEDTSALSAVVVDDNMAAKPTVLVPVPKNSSNSMCDYVKYFARVAKANEWSDDRAALMFGGCLEVGSTWLDDLDEETVGSFSKLKSALTSEGESFREAEVQKFFNTVSYTHLTLPTKA